MPSPLPLSERDSNRAEASNTKEMKKKSSSQATPPAGSQPIKSQNTSESQPMKSKKHDPPDSAYATSKSASSDKESSKKMDKSTKSLSFGSLSKAQQAKNPVDALKSKHQINDSFNHRKSSAVAMVSDNEEESDNGESSADDQTEMSVSEVFANSPIVTTNKTSSKGEVPSFAQLNRANNGGKSHVQKFKQGQKVNDSFSYRNSSACEMISDDESEEEGKEGKGGNARKQSVVSVSMLYLLCGDKVFVILDMQFK